MGPSCNQGLLLLHSGLKKRGGGGIKGFLVFSILFISFFVACQLH